MVIGGENVVFWRREFAMRQIFGSLTLVDEMVGPTLLFVSRVFQAEREGAFVMERRLRRGSSVSFH
jgi:hypothetical protein